LPVRVAEAAKAFACIQSVIINAGVVALLILGLRMKSREILTVAGLVILVAAIKVFLFDLFGASGLPLVFNPGWGFRLMTILTLTTGSVFVMWLGEQITERGIGNGMSLLIFAGIVVGLPSAVAATLVQLQTGELGPFRLVALVAIALVGLLAIGPARHRLSRRRREGRPRRRLPARP